MRILVTGATGFAGGYLLESLLADGSCVLLGTGLMGQWPEDLQHLEARVQIEQVQVTDQSRWAEVLKEFNPDQIYHLAGLADVGRSFQDREEAWEVNLLGTLKLYEAIMQWGGKPRVLYVSSGLIYGTPADVHEKLREDFPLFPPNPYAASKAAADLLSFQYFCFPGLPIVRARPFNHIGPRQSPRFAIPSFARQIAAIEAGLQEPVITTGNLNAFRDLTDVRDMVNAYKLLMAKGIPGEAYNIAGECCYNMEEILQRLVQLSSAKVTLSKREDLIRKAEAAFTQPSAEKLRKQTQWRPGIPMETTLLDTLNYWREQVQRNGIN